MVKSNKCYMFIKLSKILFFIFIVNAQTYTFYNSKCKPIHFNPKNPSIFILKNSKNCMNCFEELYVYLDSVFKEKKIYFLICCKHTSIRNEYRNFKNICKKDQIFFEFIPDDVSDDMLFMNIYPKGGLFEKYQVDITPSVVVFSDNKTHYIDFSEFYFSGYFDKEILKNKISDIFDSQKK